MALSRSRRFSMAVLTRSSSRSRTLGKELPATSLHLPRPCCTYMVGWMGSESKAGKRT